MYCDHFSVLSFDLTAVFTGALAELLIGRPDGGQYRLIDLEGII
jgi:hypothetical protein